MAYTTQVKFSFHIGHVKTTVCLCREALLIQINKRHEVSIPFPVGRMAQMEKLNYEPGLHMLQ